MRPLNDVDEQIMNEENTKQQYITPVLQRVWCNDGDRIVMEYGKGVSGHFFTDGMIEIEKDGSVHRGKRKKVDYLLLFKYDYPLALVEAKGYEHDVMEGVQQALDYALLLDVPFAYSCNGRVFHEEDLLTKENREFGMDEFPSSDELWTRYKSFENISPEQENLMLSPYFVTADGKTPRYYQRNAINKTIDAIAKGMQRLLLVMATGTGKTFVAMQIIYRMYLKGIKKKILFLVDRTALAEQTFDAFVPFKDSKVWIGQKYGLKTREDIQKLSSYEIFISLYHQFKSGKSDNEEEDVAFDENSKNYYRNLPADFFDLIIVDECHRGSLNEEKGWHEMLEYFGCATQIGLTATPKETVFGSNIKYFCEENGGEPIYTYSLQQGIKDGFLAPYKVIAVELDIDRDGYTPQKGDKDIHGNDLEIRRYEAREYDRKLVIDKRRLIVAQQITHYLKSVEKYTKTIVFCETEEHAGAMLKLLRNMNKDLLAENDLAIVRITANDKVGKDQIKNFSAPSQKFPVIAVTSKLLSTGIDTQTVGVIILDKTISSMSEFKQTIGRGTRIKENYELDGEIRSKMHFTIIDFRKNYLHFSDPEFDGDVEVVEGGPSIPCETRKPKRSRRPIQHILGRDVEVAGTKVFYFDENLNRVSENIDECISKNIKDRFDGVASFQEAWFSAADKAVFAKELLLGDEFILKMREKLGFKVELYDLVCYLGFGLPIPEKQVRIQQMTDYIVVLNDGQREVMKLLIECYRGSDFTELYNMNVFDMPIFMKAGMNRKAAIAKMGGSKERYFAILNTIEKIIYGGDL